MNTVELARFGYIEVHVAKTPVRYAVNVLGVGGFDPAGHPGVAVAIVSAGLAQPWQGERGGHGGDSVLRNITLSLPTTSRVTHDRDVWAICARCI